MAVVVTDTGPLHYLILIERVDLLPLLFGAVLMPTAVRAELNHPEAPTAVRAWMSRTPAWLTVRTEDGDLADVRARFPYLDDGELAVMALAAAEKADLILMDDRAGVSTARGQGFAVTGTLGILDLAARRGLVDLAETFARLQTTSFRYRQELLDKLLARHRAENGRT